MLLNKLNRRFFEQEGGDVDTTGGGQGDTMSGGDTLSGDTQAGGDTLSGDTQSGGDTLTGGQDTLSGDTLTGGDWPEDWRTKAAGGDEKKLKQLERYASPQAMADALFAAQNKIRTGELKTAKNPDATPEELAQWRKDNGIPESADKYDLTLPDGIVIGEADKPIIDTFLDVAHKADMHPSQVKEALSWFYKEQQAQAVAQEQIDSEVKQKNEDIIRSEWGADYRTNVKAVNAFLDTAPEGYKEKLLTARLPDGSILGNDPASLRWLAGLARELNPISSVVGSSDNAVATAQNELNQLKALMGDHESAYWKGPEAEKNQARYRQLTEALSKRK